MDNQNPTPQPSPQPATSAETDKEVIIGKCKIKVLRSVCIGAVTCIAISGATFELDAENKAVIKAESTDTPQNILMAAQSCPVKAIEIFDTETNQKIWPN